MGQEIRTVRYDQNLDLELYRFQGIVQPFPDHIHDYYAIGRVEEGVRRLSCKGQEHTIGPGDILLLAPGDSHGCIQADGGTFSYSGLAIQKGRMLELAQETAGIQGPVGFPQSVVKDPEAGERLAALCQMVLSGGGETEKQGLLAGLLSLLLARYAAPPPACCPKGREEVEAVCRLIRERYSEPLSLEQLCRYSALSRSALLRAFVREKGIAPYRYLQSVRLDRAKALLEAGVSPAEAALRAGFADQSHLTHSFRQYIGSPPAAHRRMPEGPLEKMRKEV